MSENVITVAKLDLWYGLFQALIAVDMAVERQKITALIGPSGCGKSTLLRVLNRKRDVVVGDLAHGGLTPP